MSDALSELKAMETMYGALESLDSSARQRAVKWLLGALDMTDTLPEGSAPEPGLNGDGRPSDTPPTGKDTTPARDLSPKAFISLKQPQSVVERITCLAFYLTHYRQTPHFSGIDIEKLNTEAAGRTINPSRDPDNASRAGYLVPAENRKRQISAKGEELVNALPDREAAKALTAKYGPQRRRRSASTKKRVANGDSE
jgi:hypothetical protein